MSHALLQSGELQYNWHQIGHYQEFRWGLRNLWFQLRSEKCLLPVIAWHAPNQFSLMQFQGEGINLYKDSTLETYSTQKGL